MKNVIMIYDGKTYQFDSIEELKSFLFDGIEKRFVQKYMYQKCFGFCAVNKLKILNTNVGVYGDRFFVHFDEKTKNIDNAFVLDNEDTFILSLCRYNIITLLEEKNNREYTKNEDVSSCEGNYIHVNYYAKKIIKEIVGD